MAASMPPLTYASTRLRCPNRLPSSGVVDPTGDPLAQHQALERRQALDVVRVVLQDALVVAQRARRVCRYRQPAPSISAVKNTSSISWMK